VAVVVAGAAGRQQQQVAVVVAAVGAEAGSDDGCYAAVITALQCRTVAGLCMRGRVPLLFLAYLHASAVSIYSTQ
jgi:hypothetical protein